MNDEIKEGIRPTPFQLYILQLIAQHPGCNRGELRKMHKDLISEPSMGQAVSKAKRQGYVYTKPGGKLGFKTYLTIWGVQVVVDGITRTGNPIRTKLVKPESDDKALDWFNFGRAVA